MFAPVCRGAGVAGLRSDDWRHPAPGGAVRLDPTIHPHCRGWAISCTCVHAYYWATVPMLEQALPCRACTTRSVGRRYQRGSIYICRVKNIPSIRQDLYRILVGSAVARSDLEAKVESVRPDIKTLDSRLSAKFNVLGLRRRLDARLPFRARAPQPLPPTRIDDLGSRHRPRFPTALWTARAAGTETARAAGGSAGNRKTDVFTPTRCRAEQVPATTARP